MARLLTILALVLIVFGPQDLPRLARTLGWAREELRRASADLLETFRAESEVLEREEAAHPPEAQPPFGKTLELPRRQAPQASLGLRRRGF